MRKFGHIITIALILISAMLLPLSVSFAEDFSVTVTCWGEDYKINYVDAGISNDDGGWLYLTGDKPMINDESIQLPIGAVVDIDGDKVKPYEATATYQDGIVHYVFLYNRSFLYHKPKAVWIWPEGDENRAVLLWPSGKDRLDEKYEIITFGHYEQDSDLSNGPEPIEWLLLEKDDEKVLLVSRKVLDYGRYNNSLEDVTWENCSIRQWLNTDFLDTAFSNAERAKIITATVTADESRYSTTQGNNTEDKVFLLSYAEAKRYFESDEDRRCFPTAYAVDRGAAESDTGRAPWALRSASSNNREVACVTSDGKIVDHVYVIDSDCLRPAIVLNISELEN